MAAFNRFGNSDEWARSSQAHVANVRSDSRQVIGVVTAAFQTIQNQEPIELADAVRNDQQLRFCNAGVVASGARVFFQCRGDSFDIGDDDDVSPFMLFCIPTIFWLPSFRLAAYRRGVRLTIEKRHRLLH